MPPSLGLCSISEDRTVTLKEVIHELRNIRSDRSTGPDNSPANMIKMVADFLGSPLTDVINTCTKNLCFPSAWKLARICAIPKGNQIKSEKDLRPISILPVLSKVYERLIFRQLSDFIDKNNVLNSNISAYRKGQSATTVLQAIRDDIVKAMKRSELSNYADLSQLLQSLRFDLFQKSYPQQDEQTRFLKRLTDMDTQLCYAS